MLGDFLEQKTSGFFPSLTLFYQLGCKEEELLIKS